MTTIPATAHVGQILREWRLRRRLSQLDLALRTGVSSRHVSFVETGRTRPSRHMLLRLAEELEIPLRERNHLLLGGGFAPVYPERSLDSAELAPVRDAVRQVLTGHSPYPAVAVDRHFNAVETNRAARWLLTEGVAADLLEPPVNTLRCSLHPRGFAPRVANLGEWRAHLLTRPRRVARGGRALAYPPGNCRPAKVEVHWKRHRFKNQE